MLEKSSQFLSSEQPCEQKSSDVAALNIAEGHLNIAEVELSKDDTVLLAIHS